MAGVCVTVLAIMGMILCGYALSVQESERITTGYEYVTDISGLFDYSQDPQYVPYNPSANWSGFYTDSPGTTSGIDYDTSDAANSTPTQQPRTQLSSQTVTMAWDTWDHAHPPGDGINETTTPTHYYISDTVANESQGNTAFINYPTVVMMTSIISSLSLDESWDSLTVTFDEGTIIAAPQSAWTSRQFQTNPGNPIPVYVTEWFLAYTPYGQATRLEIDREGGIVRAFNGDDYLDSFQLNSLTISFNGGSVYQSNATGLTNLGSSMDVTAYTSPTPIYMDTNGGVTLTESSVSWSNGYPVGAIDILFRVPNVGTAYTNTLTIPLTNGPDGSNSGTINAYVAVATSGRVLVTLSSGGVEQTIDIGQWRNFMLSLDFVDGEYSIVPVTQFATFNDFTALEDSRMFNRITVSGTAGTITWGYSGASLTLGVAGTAVFMETYGVVMTDPTLTISEWFPELADLRLNFYSFALYGESITINGEEYPLDDGARINVPYMADGVLVDSWHTLTNIYITFEDRVYLTFVNDGYTADLGEMTTDTIEFSGNWYFTSGLYEGYETTETYFEWTFEDFIFDSDAAIIVFLGLLAVGTAVVAKFVGIRGLDIIVVVCAGVFGYVMLGVFP